jgi:hypothetical protein
MSNELQTWDQLSKEDLIAWINQMIEKDFNGLLNLLYRMDINETKLRKMLFEIQHEDAAKIIAAMMIERQLQKEESKKLFKQEGEIPEDEKW